MKRRRKLFLLLAPYLFLGGVFLLLEMTVRQHLPHISRLQLVVGATLRDKVQVSHGNQIFQEDALLGWKLSPNLKNIFWDFTTFSTNDQGMRHDGKVQTKGKNTTRIVSLGDSITFGFRVPLSFPSDPFNYDRTQLPYTELLRDDLQREYPDRRVEVLPMAVPGYSTYQGLKWLERDITKLKPDIVIVQFGWNDTEFHQQTDKQALSNSWVTYYSREVISHSQALIYFTNWIHNYRNNSQPVNSISVPRVPLEDFISNVLAIVKLAQDNGSKVIIIAPIYMDTQSNGGAGIRIAKYRTALLQTLAKSEIPFLEVAQLTDKGWPANASLFGEPVHPNALGHRLIADELLKFIDAHRMLQ